ncbi:PleD family two-component system response regulator [Terriglobus sp. TAA 43]|uniref:response regulator n=1 Tax=Terriglobus sp. TAA 43 TaxID=278961 RepID=UPI0006911A46|nr:response regulator [Terriglobus sp. TAA 43]
MKAYKVLVIDDNRARCQGLAELLTLQGFEAYAEFGGTEGIARARSLRPDAVLLDLHMPDMDGVEVMTMLRDDPSMQSVAIILLTAEGSPVSTHGSDAFLTFPFETTTLTSVLLGCITRRKQTK